MTYVKPVKYISQAICKERRQLIKQRLHGGHVITVWLKWTEYRQRTFSTQNIQRNLL
jgi:hypothetical protein